MKLIWILLLASARVLAGDIQPAICSILSMHGTAALYLKPMGVEVMTVYKGTIITLQNHDGERKTCQLDHYVYPFIEPSGEAFDLRNGQQVFKENGEKFRMFNFGQ